jgi:hypothetical protein
MTYLERKFSHNFSKSQYWEVFFDVDGSDRVRGVKRGVLGLKTK